MLLPLPLRADILKTVMLEDRREISTIRATLYNTTSVVTFASFTFMAYMLHQSVRRYGVYVLIDGVLLAIVWGLFFRLRKDLWDARQGLALRERLITQLDESSGQDGPFRPFQSAKGETVTITDPELWWLPIFVTTAVVLKLVILQFILGDLVEVTRRACQ